QAIDMGVLTERFHQPFESLPASCDAVEATLHQTRISIEVLRSYLEEHAPSPARAAALAAATGAFVGDAYTSLLKRLGTSYDEIRLARTAADADRRALAERLGIDLTAPRGAGDELDRWFLDPLAQLPDPTAVTEAALE